jgi:acyl-coenzyme A synthetase/AMP-(fatty) acid ligase
VCYRGDGNLTYIGRSDQQIKLRGYRVELGEIEQMLTQHPAVREAIVTTRENQPGDKQLSAYYISTQQTPANITSLRDFLKEKLPAHMVPSSFVQVTP